MNTFPTDILWRGSHGGFTYLLKCATHYKIGKSRCCEGVIQNARRFDASIRLLTCWPYFDAEGELHKGLKQYRISNEQFALPDDVAQWICSLDDREFGEWWSVTGFDARTIGWNFPRVFSRDNDRGWSCLYHPKTDAAAWGMVLSKTKPEYSDLEKIYRQHPRVFRNVFLGGSLPRSEYNANEGMWVS
jgi:hypothetical protein